MKSKQKQKKRSNNQFWNTIQEIRKMTNDHMNQKEKKHFAASEKGMKQKGQKMPLKMLQGIRSKIIDTYKKQKERAITENIQYDSVQRFHDTKFLEKHINKKKQKSEYLKNNYKYKDMKSKQFGDFKGGVLNVSSKDLKNLNGPTKKIQKRRK
ncbi:hypothetical protein TTHERM_00773800 (macronuclear) [Tetrahymena thermophila SB210]|uniref:Uncharacterized protein n=1 Tax=Tetrahymena thermophila (strain SB210) TaxID=312017 RepID=I7M605_TETTS|nr:hypothetical protein TTHERM_00773800 [Tetrahymena thermophila SB210]EAR83970.2 hypothetical protein TTHERM_00773800 [Tetrahymena thermophila SB210]|eukprot:XP_001031633.2 hypothetical protein TTHERM_00773800 [Tetrahymena thermophila SB210]